MKKGKVYNFFAWHTSGKNTFYGTKNMKGRVAAIIFFAVKESESLNGKPESHKNMRSQIIRFTHLCQNIYGRGI